MNLAFLKELLDDDHRINIVDIGAGDGGYKPSYQLLIDADFANIIGFEPDEEACKKLNAKGEKNAVYYPHFIGDGKDATFHETNWSLTGSLFPPNTPLLRKFDNLNELVTLVDTHPVKTTRLDDIDELDRADFIKMDIQGAELMALENAQELLKSTFLVQAEVEFLELYKGQPLFSEVEQFMRSQGFLFHAFDGSAWAGRPFKPLGQNKLIKKSPRQMLWADAFFVRDWSELDRFSKNELVTFAILITTVTHAYDMAHLILSHLDKVYKTKVADRFLRILPGAEHGRPIKNMQPIRKIGRNAPCHGGSGKKFKHCHGAAL
ncbi:MAG: FkbM family methyltransferase [Rhizobiaceae bacterium]